MDILFSISRLAFKGLFHPKRTGFFRPTLKFKPSADPLGVILGLGKKFVKYFDDKPKKENWKMPTDRQKNRVNTVIPRILHLSRKIQIIFVNKLLSGVKTSELCRKGFLLHHKMVYQSFFSFDI
jgi:hypothetical protein